MKICPLIRDKQCSPPYQQKGKDIRLLTNWRLLSLLNSDYTILAKTLSNRLQIVINKIISQDRAGCINARLTFGNIWSIIDVINYTKERKLNGILLFLDYEKAFDTINWDFMITRLKILHFGKFYVDAIKILYDRFQQIVPFGSHYHQF